MIRVCRLLVMGCVCSGVLLSPAWGQSLDETFVSAYRSNPTLLAAQAELRAVNEGVPQELAGWRPFLSANSSFGSQWIDDGGPAGSESTTPFEAAIGVAQPLYRGGRTVAGVDRAEAEVRAQRERLDSIEQTVLLAAATAYMNVWRDQAVVKLNLNNEQVLTRELEATRDRFEVGELTRTDVAQSESRLARATAERVRSEGDLESSRAIFEEVVGMTPGVLDQPPPPGGLPANLDEAIATTEASNPDLRAAVFSEEAARHQVRVSVGELLPEVSLTAELRHAEDQSSENFETNEARILAQVSVPLYQRGFVSSRVREDKQTLRQRRIEIDETRRRVLQDTIDSWDDLVTARASVEAFESEVASAEVALDGVRQENLVGQRTVLDVLDAEQELLDAQVNLTRSQRDVVVSAYQVRLTTGNIAAADLGLAVEIYDPDVDYEAVRDLWFGLDIPDE
jgi:TolC family type I secretion outer membrane protein